MAENESLTPKQFKFLSLLLASKTITEASKDAGIGESTAYRWLNDPAFKHALDASQKDLFDQGMTALKSKFVNAVQALDRNLNADQAADQIRSAKTIIEQVIANQHLVDRIAELEVLVAQQEEERLYFYSVDLRELTRAERDQLEAIEEARALRASTKA
jgi:phage terminase small subunit